MTPSIDEEVELIDGHEPQALFPDQPLPVVGYDQTVEVKGGEKRSVAFSPGNPAKRMQVDGSENIHVTVENTRFHPVLEASPKPETAKKRNKKKKQMKTAKDIIEEGLSHEGAHFKTFATRHVTIILRKMGKPKKRLFILPSNIFLFCQ